MQQNPHAPDKAKVFAVIFTICIFGAFIIWILSSIENVEEDKPFTESQALQKSWIFVKEKLISPHSADFPYSIDGVYKVNDTTYNVSSYVDSQNGFGAMIRSNYSCQIIYSPSLKKAYCNSLVIH